jgi:salicylate hydroxylase
MVHRADFHKVLLGAVFAASPDGMRAGNGRIGFDQAEDRVTLHLANDDRVSGDVLIGADGVHSRIRQQMFGDGKAQLTGIVAWRGLVPMERLPPHQRRLVGANWMGVGGRVVTYPLRRGEILNFVGVVERDDWRLESWNEPGSREECLRDFDQWHEDVKTIIRNIGGWCPRCFLP